MSICDSCRISFQSDYHLVKHQNSRNGAQCRKTLALEMGNGNILPVNYDVEEGELGRLHQRQPPKRLKLNPRLFGSYSNANLMRLAQEYGWSQKEYADVVDTIILDPRWDSKTVTVLTKYKMNEVLDEVVVPVLNTEGMILNNIVLGGITYAYYRVENTSFQAALMLTNPALKGSICYKGVKLYVPGHEGDPSYRIYSEPWTGDIFLEFEKDVKLRFGDDVDYVGIDLHIDGTVVVGLGRGTQVKYTVVSMTLLNLTSAARNANMGHSNNRTVLCYMPVFVPGSNAAENECNNLILSQLVMEDLFKCFLINDGLGPVFEVTDANGDFHTVCPGIGILHQDLEDLWSRTLIISKTCPYCKCPPSKLSDCANVYTERKSCAELRQIWEGCQNAKDRTSALYDEGFKGFPFWGWDHARLNPYRLLSFDMLHIVDKTVCGDDLFGRCLTGALQGTRLNLTTAQVRHQLVIINDYVKKLPYFQMTTLTHHTKCFWDGIRLGDTDSKWKLGRTICMEGICRVVLLYFYVCVRLLTLNYFHVVLYIVHCIYIYISLKGWQGLNRLGPRVRCLECVYMCRVSAEREREREREREMPERLS